jgi:hypothetical protein
LQIRLLHEYVRHLDGADFTDEDLQDYQAKARFYLGGIDSAATALKSFVASKVQNENLQDTGEGNTLTCMITKMPWSPTFNRISRGCRPGTNASISTTPGGTKFNEQNRNGPAAAGHKGLQRRVTNCARDKLVGHGSSNLHPCTR